MKKEPVKDFYVSAETKPAEIAARLLEAGGFTGRKFAEAAHVLAEMWNDEEARIVLSFPAALVATGTRGILLQLLRDRLVDLVITTCGTLDHDIARSYGEYYRGEFELDDVEVERKGYHRLGSVLVPKKGYGPLIEEKMQEWLEEIYARGDRSITSYQLAWFIGEKIGREDSLLYWANINKIPIIVPGLSDGAVGSQIWLFW